MARFIDFYKRQNLIPTHQQGISQEILGRRRMALHSDLGLPINLLKGKSVIEFGPGGGYNASQILKYSPHSYHFVDAMHPEIAVLEENIQEGKKLGVQIEFFQSFFSDFTSDIHYDLVIAEACLPGQDDPLGVLERISASVSENGFLIITNTCKTSLLSEILRSVIGKWISKYVVSESELTDKCIEVFHEHLKSLKGSTRSIKDWVLDNIVHEWHLGKSDFSLPEAATLLFSLDFSYQGGSPSFLRDFTWYKDLEKTKIRNSKEVINQYKEMELILLDYRVSMPEFLNITKNNNHKDLLLQIEITFDLAKKFLASGENSDLDTLLTTTKTLSESLVNVFNLASNSLMEFSNFPHYFKGGNFQSGLSEFKNWWGRGQQYNCFQKF